MGSEAAAGVSEMRLEERRENELRAARRKLSKFVVDHERHNLKPDDSKMKKMHAEIKRIEGTVQVRSGCSQSCPFCAVGTMCALRNG